MVMNIFERTVIGFDLRKKSSLKDIFMTSYDESVRYEEINEKFHDHLSGMNLFYTDPSDIPSLEIPLDARIIAFDLSTEFVKYLSSRNVSNPQPLPKVNMDKDWIFMGFDVVDAMTQTSLFHGFNLAISMSDLMDMYSFCFNGHGLIDAVAIAAKVAKYSDRLIPEHAPFMPCGVWLKHGSVAR